MDATLSSARPSGRKQNVVLEDRKSDWASPFKRVPSVKTLRETFEPNRLARA